MLIVSGHVFSVITDALPVADLYGTPECPGLVLALDRGGSCTGVAYPKLTPQNAIAELDLLWRREMVTLSYRACWLQMHTPDGPKRGINSWPNYAAPMSIETEADVIAAASGFIGPCCDYLFDTAEALKHRDPHLEKLVRLSSRGLPPDPGSAIPFRQGQRCECGGIGDALDSEIQRPQGLEASPPLVPLTTT